MNSKLSNVWNKSVSFIKRKKLIKASLFIGLVAILPLSYNACGPAFSAKVIGTVTTSQSTDSVRFDGPNKLDGQALYGSRCAVCHGEFSSSLKKGATVARIKSALSAIPDMGILAGRLTSDEVEAIAWVLGGRETVPAAIKQQFACAPGRAPGHSELRRLSRYELGNTIQDLVGTGISNAVAAELENIPGDQLVMNFDSLDRNVSADHIRSYNQFAQKIANALADDPNVLKTFAGDCSIQKAYNEACARSFLTSFGKKVYRRPLSNDELSRILAVMKDASQLAGDAREGFNSALTYLFQAPSFLYKVEQDGSRAPNGDGTTYALNSYELASRLSYLIWGTMPDAQLMAKADNLSLTSSTVLKAEVDRMVADPKAKIHFRHFYTQWLNPGNVTKFSYSTANLGAVDQKGLAAAMKVELQDFVDYIVWNKNGTFKDLMSSEVVFPRSDALAKIFETSTWKDGDPIIQAPANTRAGLLSRPYVLASGDDTNHPILRGAFVRRRFLCGILPSPKASSLPAGSLDAPVIDGSSSSRQIWEHKTSPVNCTVCHSRINPLGFALLSYDSLGRYQTQESLFQNGTLLGRPTVDARVKVSVEPEQEEWVNGGAQLSELISESPTAMSCFVSQWYQYAAGRIQDDNDGCSMQQAYDGAAGAGGNIQRMIKETATSPAFLVRKVQ